MDNLTAAFWLLTQAQQHIKKGTSDNKKFAGGANPESFRLSPGYTPGMVETVAQSPENRRMFAMQVHGQKNQGINQIRANKYNPQVAAHTRKNLIAYGRAVAKTGAGNCLEFSCGVAHFVDTMKKKDRPAFDLVYLGGQHDHVFVVLGQSPPDHQGKYPLDFANWDADAAVCDAWADIACLARDFADRWKQRMRNWKSANLQLAKVGAGFVDATDPSWLDAMDDADKLSYTFGA